jgi:hypothetical protein
MPPEAITDLRGGPYSPECVEEVFSEVRLHGRA